MENNFEIESYLQGLNSKPNIFTSVHLTKIENLNIEMSDIKTCSDDGKYRILTIGTVDHFMTENQAEQLFEILEKELFDKTFKNIEDKYMNEKVRADQLEKELEQLKEKTYIKGECC